MNRKYMFESGILGYLVELLLYDAPIYIETVLG
jgi:hypothetical protein